MPLALFYQWTVKQNATNSHLILNATNAHFAIFQIIWKKQIRYGGNADIRNL